jgi:hypothetical protein
MSIHLPLRARRILGTRSRPQLGPNAPLQETGKYVPVRKCPLQRNGPQQT